MLVCKCNEASSGGSFHSIPAIKCSDVDGITSFIRFSDDAETIFVQRMLAQARKSDDNAAEWLWRAHNNECRFALQ